MNKKQKQFRARNAAFNRWGTFEVWAKLSKYVPKGKFSEELKGWKPTQLKALLEYYENGKLGRNKKNG